MQASAAYWTGAGVRALSGPWLRMPTDGVLWVTLEHGGHRHVLLGADRYWMDGDRYGMTYEDAQPVHGGRLYAAWEWARGGHVDLGDTPPPVGVHAIYGIALPDDVWAQVVREHLRMVA